MESATAAIKGNLKFLHKSILIVFALGVASSLWLVGYIILPQPLIKQLVLSQVPPPGERLSDNFALSGFRSYFKKLTIEYSRFQMNQRFAIDRLFPDVKDLSPQQIGEALFQIESSLMTQRDVPHEIKQTPTMMVGLGYCDQVNGVGARILPYFFGSAEVFALVNPQGISTHSIGRYWDEASNQWTYFDMWPGRIVLFVPDKSATDGIRYRYRYNRESAWSSPRQTGQSRPQLLR